LVVWSTQFCDYLQHSKNYDKIYFYKILHFRLQHYHIDFEFYLSCKFIKSMVCPMMWILTSEESVELALDGINIPHGQWTSNIIIFYCSSKYVVTLCHKYCKYHLDEFDAQQYLWFFFILDENFIDFLYIRRESSQSGLICAYWTFVFS